ncbi:MAG: SH3 domain-containing protein [Pseudomonadota bacterium]
MLSGTERPPASTCTVIADWAASYADPIQMAVGDIITLDGREDIWDGHRWLWARHRSGKEGWVPDCLISMGSPARALEDYTAMELTCRKGEKLIALRQLHGWVFCRNADKVAGWVPERKLRWV